MLIPILTDILSDANTAANDNGFRVGYNVSRLTIMDMWEI